MRMSLQMRLAAYLLRLMEQLPAAMLIPGILILVSPDQSAEQVAFAIMLLVLSGAFLWISFIAQLILHRMARRGGAQRDE